MINWFILQTSLNNIPKPNLGLDPKTHNNQQGFTLLEVMVSLGLMVILFSLLYGGFRFGYQAWGKMNVTSARLGEYQATYRIVRTWLSRFHPVIQSSEGRQHTAFYGTQDQVYFTAFMPSYPTRGGLYEVLFSLEQESGAGKLLVSRRFFDPDRDILTRFTRDQGEVLAEGVAENARFEYFGRKSEDVEPLWHGEWLEPHRYPQLIRLRLSEGATSQASWPDLLIPITVNYDSICLYAQPEERGFCDAVRQGEKTVFSEVDQ